MTPSSHEQENDARGPDASTPHRHRRRRWWIVLASIVFALGLLVGVLAWLLLRQRPVERLYGEYPEEAASYVPSLTGRTAARPNIIVIYADDLGHGDLGFTGNTVIRTPHIDALASAGIVFTDFYACSAVCAPSRVGLLTGRYPFRTGITGNAYPEDEPLGKRAARQFGVLLGGLGVLDIQESYVVRGISPHELTIAEALSVAGYRTGMIGKWHLGDYSSDPQYNPVNHGFDSYFGVPYSNDMSPFPLYRNLDELDPDLGQDEDQAALTGLYTREAVRFIESDNEAPFFLYLAHTFPHQPIFASPEFAGQSRAGPFGDAVEEIDWSVGEIMTALERAGIAENTLVVFTSDNGPWYEGSAGAFRGRKGQSFDGGFRVPFVAVWPNEIPAGAVQDDVAMNLDLFPSFLELAGVEPPADRMIDGRSIVTLLEDETVDLPERPVYFHHYYELEGVRLGPWKYLDRVNRYTWPIPLDSTSVPDALGRNQLGTRWPLLYNLETDAGEAYNVIDHHPDVAARLDEMMAAWEVQAAENPRGFASR
jgi:uncharacterized sulfatase